ncbi:MAG: hypothetical protein U0637_13755 [Phycisphaerales bacterium]
MKPAFLAVLSVGVFNVCTHNAWAQCALRNNIRVVQTFICGETNDTSTDTNWLQAGPLVSSGGHTTPPFGTGCQSSFGYTIVSDYGMMAWDGTVTANSCSDCGIFMNFDSATYGGFPKSQFMDRITVTSSSLPGGSPVTVHRRLEVSGGFTAGPNAGASLACTFSGGGRVLSVSGGAGIDSDDVILNVGTSYDIAGSLAANYFAATTNFNQASTYAAGTAAVVTLEILTPGASLSSCSGHNYAPPQTCDPIDFNNDGLFPDTQDIDDFLTVFSGGPCSTNSCADIDFNNDGLFPDTADIDALLSVFSGGPCT